MNEARSLETGTQHNSAVEVEINGKIETKEQNIREYIEYLHAQGKEADVDEIKRRFFEVQFSVLSTFEITRTLGQGHEFVQKLRDLEGESRKETDIFFNTLFQEGMHAFESDVVEGDMNKVELAANYEGNKTLLLIKRLHNTKIKEQLTQFLYLDRKCELYLKKAPDMTEVGQTLEETLEAVAHDTPISMTGETPSGNKQDGVRENMDIFWKPRGDLAGNVFGDAQKSYVEAHEKGHTIRKIRSVAASTYVHQGFNFDAVTFSDQRVDLLIEFAKGQDVEEIPEKDEVIEGVLEYFNDPTEIIERMAQLKNYFGMSGSEIFTRAHLQYAREHYNRDTQMDNYMTEFFMAITPETEDRFLQLINTCGI